MIKSLLYIQYLYFKNQQMGVLTLDENNTTKSNKFLNYVKTISNRMLGLFNLIPHHDDEIGVDNRSQTQRHLDQNGVIWELEQERAKEENEMLKKRLKDGK